MPRRALICAAFATCCFLNTWAELAQGAAPYFARYDPLYATLPAVIWWEVLIFAALFGAWELCRRWGKTRSAVADAAFLALCVWPFGIASVALLRVAPLDLVPLVRQSWFWPAALLVLLPIAVLSLRNPRRTGGWVRSGFLYSCPVLAVVLVQATRATLLRYPHAAYADGPLAARVASGPAPSRVVWIIFDELSQAIAFEHRPATLKLPHFDALRAQSIYATAAHAPAGDTQESLPSLILGQRAVRTEPRGPDSLYVYTESRPAGFEWRSAPNVFDRARELGYDSALAGWFHPYGRLIGRSLVACDWTPGELLSGIEEPFERVALPAAMRHRARCQFTVFPLIGHLPGYFPRKYQRELKSARFRYLLERSCTQAADPSIGLVFVHLPVPHPPAIYNRAAGTFTNRGPNNYLDGVALADWTLGKLQQSIEQAGLGSRTTLIVTADHGWRMIWRGDPDWTPEEEAASRGIDTSGVPFLVRLPGESSVTVLSTPFDIVITADLVLGILRGHLRNAAAVRRYFEMQYGS